MIENKRMKPGADRVKKSKTSKFIRPDNEKRKIVLEVILPSLNSLIANDKDIFTINRFELNIKHLQLSTMLRILTTGSNGDDGLLSDLVGEEKIYKSITWDKKSHQLPSMRHNNYIIWPAINQNNQSEVSPMYAVKNALDSAGESTIGLVVEKHLSLDEWLNEPIADYCNNGLPIKLKTFNRKKIIKMASNNWGGAHYNKEIDVSDAILVYGEEKVAEQFENIEVGYEIENPLPSMILHIAYELSESCNSYFNNC